MVAQKAPHVPMTLLHVDLILERGREFVLSRGCTAILMQ